MAHRLSMHPTFPNQYRCGKKRKGGEYLVNILVPTTYWISFTTSECVLETEAPHQFTASILICGEGRSETVTFESSTRGLIGSEQYRE